MLEIEEQFDPALLGIVYSAKHDQSIDNDSTGGKVDLNGVDSIADEELPSSVSPALEDSGISPARAIEGDKQPYDDQLGHAIEGDGLSCSHADSEDPHEVKAIDYGQGTHDIDTIESPDSLPIKRAPRYRLVRTRIPGSRRSRISVRRIHPVAPSTTDASLTEPGTTDATLTDAETASIPPVTLPTFPEPLDSIAQAFGAETAEKIQREAKENAGSGIPLPRSFRDVFEALDDMTNAISIANGLRQHLGVDKINERVGKKGKDRIRMIRQIAKMREKMYLDLYTALILPDAPVLAEDKDTEDESVDGKSAKSWKEAQREIVLTPSNLEILSKSIPKFFPLDKKALKAFMPLAMGESGGKVVWQNGVGRVVGAEGGFRGKVQEGHVHVFVDHSNILYGLLHHLYNSTSDSLPPKHLRTLSLPSLALLLRRGRPTPPGTLHLLASSPLMQSLDPAVRLGFEVSIMKRVEIYSDEVEDPNAMTLQPKPMERVLSGPGDATSTSTGLRRYKEQGVDEILHLKILQTLNAYTANGESEKATIVLATGDAKGGQFNRDGFVGAVREALRRGWNVELWSWSEGLSRTWKDICRREKWGQAFGIHVLDDWAEQLVEVQASPTF